jgi:hypothetical protein
MVRLGACLYQSRAGPPKLNGRLIRRLAGDEGRGVMEITNFLWRFLPDRCSMPHCTRFGVRGNENVVDGRLMCDQCHAIHLLRRSVANEFAATMERVEDALRE